MNCFLEGNKAPVEDCNFITITIAIAVAVATIFAIATTVTVTFFYSYCILVREVVHG